MNLHNKHVLILGFNSSLGFDLIQHLRKYNCQITIAGFNNTDFDLKIAPMVSNAKFILANSTMFETFLKQAHMVINLTLCPSVQNLSTKVAKKVKFVRSLVKDGKLNNIPVFSIIPSLTNDKFNPTARAIKQGIFDLNTLPKSTLIQTGCIFSKNDSLLSDIYTCIYKYNMYPVFKRKQKINFIDSKDLCTVLIQLMLEDKLNITVNACFKEQADLKTIVDQIIKCSNITHPLKPLSKLKGHFINLFLYPKLLSFTIFYNKCIITISPLSTTVVNPKTLGISLTDSTQSIYANFSHLQYISVDYRNAVE